MTVEIPRGISNKNPCNIRISSSFWFGKVEPSTDPDFEQFDDPADGIRAACKILIRYYTIYGLQTVRGIISRWAPGNENDTTAYVDDVCSRMAVGADDVLDLLQPEILQSLVTAIIVHENGCQPYDQETIASGVAMGLSGFPSQEPKNA